jgi:hypothetical protein
MTGRIEINAAYASVVEDDEDGILFVGFAEGEEDDEPYALFRQALEGGPVWFEVSDESFGAADAVQSVVVTPDGLTITIAPDAVAKFGFASVVNVLIGPDCEDSAEGIDALRTMLGGRMTG